MKIPLQSVLASFGLVIYGSQVGAAEPQKSPAPIVIRVTDLARELECIRVSVRETQEDGHLRKAAYLACFFKASPTAEVDLHDAVRNHRPVQIVDGTNLVVECLIAGTASLRKSDNEVFSGFSLRFDSVADAERAADAISEDLATWMRRHMKDRRSWSI